VTTLTAPAVPVARDIVLTTRTSRRRSNTLAKGVFIAAALTTFAVTILIIVTLAFDAWEFIRHADVTGAPSGQGWQIVLTVVIAGLAAHAVGRLTQPRISNRWARRGIKYGTFAAVVAIGFTVIDAWMTLNRLLDSITDVGWFPRRGIFDVGTLIVGTLVVAGLAMLVAAPLGLGAAIYLAEYAHPRVRRTLKPILEMLAGVPSVVLAYFAISWISPNIVNRFFNPQDQVFSMLAAGLAVGVLTVPIIASVAEDALRSVPMPLREASFGLGANRATTTFRVVFPAGISGVVAALILGMSRAVGETMVVAIAAGAVGGALFHFSPLKPGQTMTAAMAALSFGSDQVAGSGAAYQSLFFVGSLLFFMTLGLNLLGDRLVARVREVY
jgi:phosphate transport system permease protein